MALLDPMISLAISMQSYRGGYALLLGSGVSRPAQIPTGWEVVIDLIKRVAAAAGETPTPTPEAWYVAKFGKAPSYTELLGEVAKTPAERQRLLRAYFEPQPGEAERGIKVPTAAHRSIAELVRDGHVRVIVTTNFDRLIERALEDVGIVPTVIQSADGFKGAHPFQHNQCTVLKVHGDYLDTRIRNTDAEVAKYPMAQRDALRRVFDEHGLIICGWSGDWDVALKRGLESSAQRRYGVYWVSRGQIGSTGATLTTALRAEVVSGMDADGFFTALGEKTRAVARLARTHPLSAPLAAQTVKEYLVEDRFRIRLSDLVGEEAAKTRALVHQHAAQSLARPFDKDSLMLALEAYESSAATLGAMLATGAFWSDDDDKDRRELWTRPIARVASIVGPLNGAVDAIELARYTSTLLAYAVGVAAVAKDRLTLLRQMLVQTSVLVGSTAGSVGMELYIPINHLDRFRSILGSNRRLPLHERMEAFLRPLFATLIPDDAEFARALERFEYLWALSFVTQRAAHRQELSSDWGPPGLFYVTAGRFAPPPILATVQSEIDALGHQWPPLRSGVVVGDLDAVLACKAAHDKRIATVRANWI